MRCASNYLLTTLLVFFSARHAAAQCDINSEMGGIAASCCGVNLVRDLILQPRASPRPSSPPETGGLRHKP